MSICKIESKMNDENHLQQQQQPCSFLSSSLSQSECDFIRQGCNYNCRNDGRSNHQFRHYTIQTNSNSNIKMNHIMQGSIQCSSLFVSSLSSCYGSSRLYDTITNGSLIDMICSIKAELVQPSSSSQQQYDGEIELSLLTDTISSSSNHISRVLQEYQTALQQYYVPCILNSIKQNHQKSMHHNNLTQPAQENCTPLCITPGIMVWKLYIDVYIVSLLSNNDYGNCCSSVYFLDAVTHCINSALYETKLPSISIRTDDEIVPFNKNSSTTKMDHVPTNYNLFLDRIVLDSDILNAKPILQKEYIPQLPFITTTHAINNNSNPSNDITLIFDATSDEEAVSIAAIHVVVVPLLPNVPQTDCCKVTYGVGAVWKTLTGSTKITVVSKAITSCIDVAPLAYQQYQIM